MTFLLAMVLHPNILKRGQAEVDEVVFGWITSAKEVMDSAIRAVIIPRVKDGVVNFGNDG